MVISAEKYSDDNYRTKEAPVLMEKKVKDQLLASNCEYRAMREEHRAHEKRLKELSQKARLTEAEAAEMERNFKGATKTSDA